MPDKIRNTKVDILRGIAMLMVILQHTMTGVTTGSEKTLLFNVLWSIQMPLFFLISGYVTKYSVSPGDLQALRKRIIKTTGAYLRPWAMWTFLIRGLLFGQRDYLNLGYLLWHMDSGYWFLFSLWTISVIYCIAQFCANRKKCHKYVHLGIYYCVGITALLILGLLFGMTFLSIKQTVYYMVFYAVGVVFSMCQNYVTQPARKKLYITSVCVAAVVYLLLVTSVSFYEISDSLIGIMLRGYASLCGSGLLVVFVSRVSSKCRILKPLQWVGRNSLGIYLVHYLMLCLVRPTSLPDIYSVQGAFFVILNFGITTVLASGIAKLLDLHPIVRKLCLGK